MNKESVSGCPLFANEAWCAHAAYRETSTRLTCLHSGKLLLLFLTIGWSISGSAATLLTDKSDYIPGQHVIFSGSGWQPGETVNIDTYETSVDPFFWEGTVSAIVRADGTFSNGDLLVQQSFLGQGFTAHAIGASSGLKATTSFTDATSCPSPPNGIAPVNPPAGGFSITGSLLANVPSSGVGDWVSNSISSGGGFVLNADGTPVDPINTFHFVDAFGSASDDNFAGGDKVDDNPNTWSWTYNPVGNKQDINHALLHISKDGNGHTWIMIAGDRQSDNGSAYIDFEFLQNELFVTNNGAGTGGGFLSLGPNCGRTTNYFILTLSFSQGGSTAGLCGSRWQPSGSGCGFDYFDVTIPRNAVFAAVNTNVISVPYGAYGTNIYAINTFAEAAVDVTALFSNFNSCLTIGVKSIFVKTKESPSPSANITDFITPFQPRVPLVIGPAAFAGPDQTMCSAGLTNSFTLNGTAQAGDNAITSLAWKIVSGPAEIVGPSSCGSGCTNLPITVNLTNGPGTATLRLSVQDAGQCTNNFTSDDVTLTVSPAPACGITNLNPPVVAGQTNTYKGPDGATNYAWTMSFNGGPASAVGSNSQTVSIPIPNMTGSITVGLGITSGSGCTNTCSLTEQITVTDCIATLNSTTCPGTIQTNQLTVAPAPGAIIKWSINSACASILGPDDQTNVYVTASTCCSYSLSVVITNLDQTTSSCQLNSGLFVDTNPPSLTVPTGSNLGCNPASLPTDATIASLVSAKDDCTAVTTNVSHLDTITNCLVTRTFTVTVSDACTNTTTKTVIYTWSADTDKPSLSVPTGGDFGCNPANLPTDASVAALVTASDGCSAVTTNVTHLDGTTNCVVTRTFTVTVTDACPNSASQNVIYTWTADTNKPSLTVPTGSNLGCNPANLPTDASVAALVTASDGCSAVTTNVTHLDGTTNCVVTRTFTVTVTDGCTNSATKIVLYTWTTDTNKPSLTVPTGSNLGCNPANLPTDASVAALVTASDGCSAVTTNVTHLDGTTNCIVTRTFTVTVTDAIQVS